MEGALWEVSRRQYARGAGRGGYANARENGNRTFRTRDSEGNNINLKK